MSEQDRKRLREIHTFPALVRYLREDLGWPVEQQSFDDLDEITFDWEADELGIDPDQAANIEYIKQLRPLENGQPQGVFFVKFGTKRLPVLALRRLLSKLVVKKRATAPAAERPLWAMRDLVFISSYGESDERHLSFAYFQEPEHKTELPMLKVLGWHDSNTALTLDRVHDRLAAHLTWPDNPKALLEWRKDWSRAFELRHGEVVTTAKQLAEQLAALARGIRECAKQLLKLETDKGPLRSLMEAFKKALIHDLTDDQFADMYAQTIAYGLLSARITHPDPVKAETLPDLIPVTNPFLKELMETFVLAGGKHRGKKKPYQIDFDELGINDVVELLRRANMDAVLRNFGAGDRKEDPVTYFYEDFLNAYDKQERKRRGVYYTPMPVVSYIVRSVHELLQSEFGIEDGLASTVTWAEMANRHKDLAVPDGVPSDSPFVQILDPATGTATFLVETIEVILATLMGRWKKEGLSDGQRLNAWNKYVPEHLLPRLHGYELMMASYAIAHLKIGLKLFETGYRFDSDERAQVYLTNSLEPATDAVDSQIDALSEALAHEASAVNQIKRGRHFTVVLGNPPYSIQSQNLTETARAWANPYRYVDGQLIREKGALQFEKALQDDCVKFASFSQRRIVESNAGMLGLIMSHSFVDSPMLRGMRQNLGQTFNSIRVVDLHGNSTRKEHCPDGTEDRNVFDIKQGVAILVGVRKAETQRFAVVEYGEAWGTRESKYAWLETNSIESTNFQPAHATSPSFLFRPQSGDAHDEFNRGFKITDVFIEGSVGIITARDNLVIDFESGPLVERGNAFRDSTQTDKDLCDSLNISLKKGWDIERAREQIRRDRNLAQFVKPLCYRPFDSRLILYHPSLVWGMSYPTMRHMLPGGNLAMMIGRAGQVIGQGKWDIIFCTRGLTEFNLFRRGGHNLLPLYLVPKVEGSQADLAVNTQWRPNLSRGFLRELATALRIPQEGEHELPSGLTPEDIFNYAYATFHCPSYRNRYAEFLKIDFPRLPLTGNLDLFRALAQLGSQLSALHLMESPSLNQRETEFIGDDRAVVEKISWSRQTVWINRAQTTGFSGVREDVWNFYIGGYQVCEKWLKVRKGRTLSIGDIDHYRRIIVALDETIRLMKETDEVIEKHGGWPDAFKR